MQQFPLEITTESDRAIITEAFSKAGFLEDSVAKRLGLPDLTDVGSRYVKGLTGQAGEDGLGVLIRLFILGQALEIQLIERQLSRVVIDRLLSTDLLRLYRQNNGGDQGAESGGQSFRQQIDGFASPATLVPVRSRQAAAGSIWIACDRQDLPDGSPWRPSADVVFSGHNLLTRQFVQMLPRFPVSSTLELCSGTGVAAIAIAPASARVVATDITPRAVHFGRFNVWLNGCTNVEWQFGDLYEAVPGQTFECIVAHPPYVPTLAAHAVYRDGGTTGEQVLRRVVEGLPAHLAAGGQFMLLCTAFDLEGGRFEDRVRTWLGDAGGEFDLAFGLQEERTPEAYARLLVERVADAPPDDFPRWRQLFSDLKVTSAIYGVLAGRRHRGESWTAETRRFRMTDATTYDAFEWLFRWLDRCREPDHLDRILSAVPTLSSALRLEISYRPESGALVPVDFLVENTGKPFPAQLKVDPQIARLLNTVDGHRTGRDIAHELGHAEPADERATARVISHLAGRGLLLLD
jgi:SAM-dependent methyltransferase